MLWITNGILKLLKPKQKLFENFLKNCRVQNESNYRKLFETIKRKFKKGVIRKSNLINSNLPCKIFNNAKIFEEKQLQIN